MCSLSSLPAANAAFRRSRLPSGLALRYYLSLRPRPPLLFLHYTLTMEFPEPFPLPRSVSRSDHPSRRRRVSLSGKLLNFISPKPKSPPELPPRPLISHPQPLQSRVPARPKRDFRQLGATTDENVPPRPLSRPRLLSNQSTASIHTVREQDSVLPSKNSKLHVPPRRDVRPLKSALKKSASENDAPPSPISPTTDVTTRPGHVVPAPTTSSSPSKHKEPTLAKRIRTKSWVPRFPSRNHQSEAIPEQRRASPSPSRDKARPRKTVTFERDSTDSPSDMELHRTPSILDLSNADCDPAADESFVEDVWVEVAMDLDTDGSPQGKRKFECEGDPRYGTMTPRPGSPILTRDHLAFTPIVPSQMPPLDRQLQNNESKITTGAMSKGTHREVALRPFLAPVPLPTPSSAFQIPPGRTIAGTVVDEVLKDYAQEKNRVFRPIPVTKRGPAGVLQRINIDIVPHERHSTVWDANEGCVSSSQSRVLDVC